MLSGAPSPRALAATLVAIAALATLPAAAGAAPLGIEHVRATLAETSGNGDGLVGPGEDFALTERIRHADPLVPSFSNVSASLWEGDTGITLARTVSSYPNMAFGAEADSQLPFTGSISPAAECGDAYSFELNVLASQGQARVDFTASTGGPGPPSAHESADVPKPVLDQDTASSDLVVPTPGRVKDVQVRLGGLTHTATGDVTIELVAPSGAAVVLVDRRGDERNDFANTVFSDAAAQRVQDVPPPFTGAVRPEEPLASLAGEDPQGTWKLRVTDHFGSDEGQLNGWGIDLRTAICDGNPVASFTADPSPVLPGDTLTLDGSGSSDPNGSIVSWEWDLDDDGVYDATGATITTSFPERGRYPVTLRVTDDNGDKGTRKMDVSVTEAPVASFTVTPASPETGESSQLDGSGSDDPDGPDLARYEWDLDGDGEFERDGGISATTTAEWSTPGTHTVRLRVTDVDGASATHSVDVVVRNRPPLAAFTHPAPIVAGTAATFDAGATVDPDGAVSRYEWDFDGDGTYEHDAGASVTAQHTFATAGDPTVGLRVTDEHGAVATTTRQVAVTLLPTASFTATPNPVSLGRTVAFDAAGSSDPDGTIVKHEWDLDGNGSYEVDTGAVAGATHAYGAAGTYAVRLRVTDDDGARATATVSVKAANVPPSAAIAVTPATATAGQAVTFDARGSSDPDGTIVKYDWDLDGNGSFEATSGAVPTRTHTYPNAGGFTVGVRVTDNHGGSRTATAALVVRAPAAASPGPVAPTAPTGTAPPGGGDGTDSSPGAGEPLPANLRATLAGAPLQRRATVLRRGLTVACRTDRAATCTLRAELRATVARRLGLRASSARPVVLGRLSVRVGASGVATARLRLSPAAKRALRRSRRVSILVRGTARATGEGGGSVVRRTFLVRR